MDRFLDALQGGFSLVFGFLAALWGWPMWVPFILGLTAPIIFGVVILSFRGESHKKGQKGEVGELVFGFLALLALFFWAINSPERVSLSTPTPWWVSLTALPSVSINLGGYVAWVLDLVAQVLVWASGDDLRGG